MRAPDSERLRVAHATYTWLPITETWIASQIANLPAEVTNRVACDRRANGHLFPQNGVTALSDRGRWAVAAVAAARRSGLPLPAGTLSGLVRRFRPHVLHSHFGDVAWRNLRLANRAGLPHVVSVYGSDVTTLPRARRWAHRYRRLFAEASMVLCEGPHMAATVVALGCPPARARVHRLGVDVAGVDFRPRRRAPDEPLRLLMAASFREKKGIPDGIAAAGLLRRQGVDVQLTLVGGPRGREGLAEAARIEAAIAESGMGTAVRLLGYLPPDRLRAEADAHHVFMSPSRIAADGDAEGGAPVAVIEMAAAGMPVVATRHCDIPFVLASENHPFLADEGDPAGLADALRRLLASDWAAIACANRVLTEREADCRRQGERLAALYREAIARTGRTAGVSATGHS